MRIRKNANISPLLYAAATAASLNPETLLQTHICQLNQSPWDVMDFSLTSSPAPPSAPSQVRGNVMSFAENGSSQDSISVPKREKEVNYYSMTKEYAGKGTGAKAAEEAGGKNSTKDSGRAKICGKTDGKSWRCKREAAKGNILCDHHLSMVRSYSNPGHTSSKNPTKPAAESRLRSRAKKSAPSTSTNPYVFYYYSGFGPQWGKKRGGDGGKSVGDEEARNNPAQDESETEASHYMISDDEFECGEEDDMDEEDEEYEKKRSGRKRIKARSLKSLM